MDDRKFNRMIEIAKIIASITVPIMIGASGFFVQKSISEFQSSQIIEKEISVKLADRRLAVYDQIKQPLNRIYCYIEEVGDWEDISANEIKKIRQNINAVMYSNRAIWSPETFRRYSEYIDTVAFQVSDGEANGRINADMNPERLRSSGWNEGSSALLSGHKSSNHDEVYQELNDSLAADLMLSRPLHL
ncbi:hypothetical protein [Rahnella aceris]|uniref:hypothetical protein n=1 Tax=Rahnella sp. (strain Y9602) TaxID=2703885 RepID=UPI001C25A478|nr:hypothetical protein [Rahnella aceris]MBU9853103.1 hypothetical protein [Rahnella aceris]